jgi:hypothetical protein
LVQQTFNIVTRSSSLPIHQAGHLNWSDEDLHTMNELLIGISKWFRHLNTLEINRPEASFSPAKWSFVLLSPFSNHSTIQTLILCLEVPIQILSHLIPKYYPVLRKLKVCTTWSLINQEYLQELMQLTQLEEIELMPLESDLEPALAELLQKYTN